MTNKILVAVALAMATFSAEAIAQTATTFTYQGELQENGSPANGMFNIDFELWDAANSGNQVGNTIEKNDVQVVNGRFTVELDFGTQPEFGDGIVWLETEVNGVMLAPRSPVTGSPFSIQTRGLYVDQNRNVGIGTADPATRLHVSDSDATIRIQNSLSSSGSYAELRDDTAARAVFQKVNDGGGVSIDLDPLPTGVGSPADISIFRSTNTVGTKRVIFYRGINDGQSSAVIGVDGQDSYFQAHGGKVGIGTTSPVTPLHLSGDSSIMQTITSASASGTWIELDNTSTSGKRWGVVSTGAANGEGPGKLLLRSISDGSTAMTLQGDGNVGIGTASPVFQLQLTGDAGKPGGGSWSNSSDRRLKKNIQDLNGSLEKLLALRGASFEYKDPAAIHELPGQRIGMIAQEVEQVYPDWVEKNRLGYKTVTYRGFEALTVEALRELRAEKDEQHRTHAARLTELECDNAQLRGENSELKSRLDSLERLIQQLTLNELEQQK